MRAFVDSSVLFSACYSRTGGARELVRLAIKNQIALCVSDYVFAESEMNLIDNAPRAVPAFRYLRSRGFWHVVDVPSDAVVAALKVVSDRFDAPIVAAAKVAGVDYLLSFDRKHLHTRAVELFIGAPVRTPEAVLRHVRASVGRG